MSSARIITLTTDFGHGDPWVGQMKGAALEVAPQIRLVDLCHSVPAHDVAAGGYLLETAYHAFPTGTIHVAVVDPGVGSARRAVAVSTERHVFVAPDNGLLTRALDREGDHRAYAIEAEHYYRRPVSATFEGRDRFAPVAAWIARGVALEHLGPAVGDLVRLPAAVEPRAGEAVTVRVLYVDRFGNAALDVTAETVERVLGGRALDGVVTVATRDVSVDRVFRTFSDAPPAHPFLLINSAGYLEIAVREGRADEALGLDAGTEVELSLRG